MQRTNTFYIYQLSKTLTRLEALGIGDSNFEVFQFSFTARKALEKLLADKMFVLCADKAGELMQALDRSFTKYKDIPLSESSIDKESLSDISTALYAFEIALSIELDQLGTYVVTPKATHDIRRLVGNAESSFNPNHWGYLSDTAKADWISSAKCLAFDLATASGFHAIRAVEAVVVNYLAKLSVIPKKRDMGHYVELLKANGGDAKAVGSVDQIRSLHRNPLMHPEDTLETDEALDLFDLCKSSIKALLRDMQHRNLLP